MLRLCVLGPLELRPAGEHGTSERGLRPSDGAADVVVLIGSARVRRLLAALATRANSVASADWLADAVWGEQLPASPAAAVQTLVSRLRTSLGGPDSGPSGPRLLTRAPGYLLSVSEDSFDAARFTALARQGAAALRSDPATAAACLTEALSWWRGPAFAEFVDDDFARPEAARLERERVAATLGLAEAFITVDRAEEAVPLLEALATEHPLDEQPAMLLMEAHVRRGRSPEALEAYRRLASGLRGQLGLEPSMAVQALHQRILRRDGVGLAPSGTGTVTALPVATSERQDDVRASGRVGPTLFGRAAAVAALTAQLRPGGLVTVIGPGGVGKTSLAAAVTARVADRFPDGVLECRLAAVSTPARVTDALRTAVGVSPRADGATLTAVVDALAQRRALLVLDNCEHVVEALAPVVHEIADSCPDLAVLATSRTPLRVAREQVWPLRPLPVPDATDDEALAASPAVRLFLRRAAQAAPDVDLRSDLPAVAAVCRSLDGLPLALELAAARMGSMRPADLIPRLRGRLRLLDHGSASGLARHRTLQAVIGWSYDLLDDRHREVFEALAVFAGDFTLEDAEGLLARVSALVDRFPELAEPDAVAGAVGDLVDQSLVVSVPATGAARYSLLETVRVYGRAALAGRAWAAEVHRRHAEHFAALATGVAEAVYAQPHVAALDRLLSRWADLREAAAWARRHDAAVAARLIGSLIVPVESLRAPEATEWADDLLRLTAGDDTVPGLAGVAAVAAAGARFRGEIGRVTELLGLGRDRSDVTAHQRSYLGMLELEMLLLSGRFAEARRRLPAVHGQCRAAGAPAVGRMVTAIEILVEAYAGDPGQGHRQAVDLERTAAAAAEAVPAAWARYCQGECLLALDPDRAAPLLQDALARARSLGDAYLTGVTLVSLASIAGRIGDQAPAAALFAEVIRHWSEAGDRTHQRTTLVNVVELLVRAGRVESAAVLCGSLQPATDALWPSVTAALGPARAAALASSGQALGDRETVRLALSELDDLAG